MKSLFKLIPALVFSISLVAAGLVSPYSAKAQDIITNRLGMRFVRIPAGSFIMGSPTSEPGRNWNEQQHKVTISKSFYMGETEVTQGQWNKLVSPNPSAFKLGNTYPVDSVTWNEAVQFISFLNQMEGTRKYRLPTEAEWEYACRAGATTAFATGPITNFSCTEPDPALKDTAWYCYNSGLQGPARDFKPHPVKTLKPNRWGLFDMHGNVQEWVQDACKWRDILRARVGVVTDTYKENIVDPLSRTGNHRVIRGGGWYQNGKYQRCAYRSYYKPIAVRNSLGFRIVREQ
ncbi:formylglycine-generating enzyme family protein [Desulfospira joergensenii]|uniref:formylglycine-generating enzyme family protein n=1 Tax=Desulfospira joergensenii TaxID=53329 RepID=UPI0003B5FA16|nr:formylglycine-generating enzyme family protein [Desulfospira joergensenii]